MKYISRYKLYESFTINSAGEVFEVPLNDKEQTIREICLELEDCGYNIIINRYVNQDSGIVINMSTDFLYWEELKDYLLRIKEYLGDDYIRFQHLSNLYYVWEEIKLDENTIILGNLVSVAIRYKR